MKNLVVFAFILLAFSSCSKESEESKPETPYQIPDDWVLGQEYFNVALCIVIVDQTLQDRLNPESPAYFGKAYSEGIEMLYLYNGKKIRGYEIGLMYKYESFSEVWEGIQPPVRKTVDHGVIDRNTLGYYYFNADPVYVLKDNNLTTYTYLRYPDGEEDEIKVQIFETEGRIITCLDKIWINNELVYALSEDRALSYLGILPDSADRFNPDSYQDYYNPKYYPFLVPELDNEGRQLGQRVVPKYGTPIVVIMK